MRRMLMLADMSHAVLKSGAANCAAAAPLICDAF